MNVIIEQSPYYSKGWWNPPTNIALHCTAATIESTLHTFTSPSSTRKVSAHYTVDGFTEQIYQHVKMSDRAWHALGANEFAIGIEFVNNYPHGPVPEAAYAWGARLVAVIAESLGLPIDDETVGPHSRWVATACPSGLDWYRIIEEAQGGTMPFDPRTNPADDDYVKQTVRNVVLGEPHLVASALKRALVGAGYQVKEPVKKTAASARKGHGRGKSRDVKEK